ncbi:MAG: TIGR02186 family protein [Pikeienuella sp.]
MRLRLLLALLLCAAAPAAAEEVKDERVIAALSQNAVGITADFTGSEIFVFGAVGRNRHPDARDDDLDIIVTVAGPDQRVKIRKKDRAFGIWVNRESVEIDQAPSFYAVSATGPLPEILSRTDDLRHRISINRAVRLIGEAGNVENPEDFRKAVIRLNRASGVYFEEIGGVGVIERTLFQTRFQLPSNIVEGDYEARVFLLRGGRVLDSFTTAIEVRKVGIERWIFNLAHERAPVYGVLSILVALFAGWGASEAFRLLRR